MGELFYVGSGSLSTVWILYPGQSHLIAVMLGREGGVNRRGGVAGRGVMLAGGPRIRDKAVIGAQ